MQWRIGERTMDDQLRFMELAYQEALKAFDEGEVPVGAVIVRNQQVVGRGYNRIESLSDATAHAEIIAIGAASNNAETWRLNDCAIYITLEPCLMCLGAIMQSRIGSIVYAAADPRYGAIASRPYRQIIEQSYTWFPAVTAGVLQDDCSVLLKSFFSDLRKKS
jgi:tRNA(adenine34) deaminase